MSWVAWEFIKLSASMSWYSVYYTTTTVVWLWSLSGDTNIEQRVAHLEDQVWMMSQQETWIDVPTYQSEDLALSDEDHGVTQEKHDERSPG